MFSTSNYSSYPTSIVSSLLIVYVYVLGRYDNVLLKCHTVNSLVTDTVVGL